MVSIEDFVARTVGTCGEEKDLIVTFKYDKKDEAISKILQRATIKESISGMIFELLYDHVSFRLYGSGKAIFRSIKDEDELEKILASLLL